MQQFKYVALNLQKEQFTGNFIAEDVADLAVQLAKQGLYLTSAKPYNGKTPSAFFTLGTGTVSINELTTFCRQYAIMMTAGISLLNGIAILKDQNFTSYFKSLLQIIYEDVRSGMMLSAAMEKHKTVFPSFFRAMIKVGESSGKLDRVMNSLADYYENERALSRKAKGAFAYPIMLGIMTIGIVVVMLAFVIPTFRANLSTLEITPEGITKVVYDISDFVVQNGMYLLAGVVVIGLIIFGIGKTEKGHFFYDKLKVTLPVIRNLTVDMVTARFARGFGLLLSSGMDITEALDAVVIVFGNEEMERRFKLAAEEIKHGMNLSLAFQQYSIFPEIMIQMISIGEKTAALDDVLTRSTNFFDDAVETSISKLTAMIQPIMLVLLGGIVALLFLATYSPMLSVMGSLT